jgi:hypothetical protein
MDGCSACYAAGQSQAYKFTAEKVYEQPWALTLLERVFARLRDEFDRAGKQKEFSFLKVYLTGEAGTARNRENIVEGTRNRTRPNAVHVIFLYT